MKVVILIFAVVDYKIQLPYGRAWKSSGFRHPFVRYADISPNRGITRPYSGARFISAQPRQCVKLARKTEEGSVSFPVFTRADEGEVISRKAKKMLKLCRGGFLRPPANRSQISEVRGQKSCGDDSSKLRVCTTFRLRKQVKFC